MTEAMNSLFLVFLLAGCSAVYSLSVKPCDGNCNWYECHQETDKSIVCIINKKKGDNRPMKVKWTPSAPTAGNDIGFSYRSLHQYGYVMFSLDVCSPHGHSVEVIQKVDTVNECNVYKCSQNNGTAMRCKLVLCPGNPQGLDVYGDLDDWYHCIRQGSHIDCYVRPFDFSLGEECGKHDKWCKPGASKNINGKWCSCGYGGVTYHCPKEMLEYDDPDCRKERCSAGTTWREGKYLCTCSKDFTTQCNEVNETVPIQSIDTCSPRPEVCFPSENFTFGCSECHCNYAGTFASCSDSECPENPKAGPQLCRPDYRFSNGAMDCLCLQDGRSALCTAKPSISSGMMCSPRRYFPDRCNVCLCNSDGRSALCTVRHCSATSHHEGHVKSGKGDHNLH